MKLSEAIKIRIENLINQSTEIENHNQLSTKAGLSESVIRSLFSGKTKIPSTSTIFYISVAFGITLSEFYNDKLFDIDNIDDN